MDVSHLQRDLDHKLVRTPSLEPVWSNRKLSAILAQRAAEQNADSLTATEYNRARHYGDPSLSTYVLRFGSWALALRAAGLAPTPRLTREYLRRWAWGDIGDIVRRYIEEAGTTTVAGYADWAAEHPNENLPSVHTIRKRFAEHGIRWTAYVHELVEDIAHERGNN